MKKKSRKNESVLTPEQAVEFLENFRLMQAGQDKPAIMISIRVPENILDAYRVLAASEGRAYQTLMNQALREFLRKGSHAK